MERAGRPGDRGLRRVGVEQAPWPEQVRQAPGYFRSNGDRLRYEQFRREGDPMGSGTVESAAGTVVPQRMKRPGRGWTRKHAQAMWAALSELHRGRFKQA